MPVSKGIDALTLRVQKFTLGTRELGLTRCLRCQAVSANAAGLAGGITIGGGGGHLYKLD